MSFRRLLTTNNVSLLLSRTTTTNKSALFLQQQPWKKANMLLMTPTRFLSTSNDAGKKLLTVIEREISEVQPTELEQDLQDALSKYRMSTNGTEIKLDKKVGNGTLVAKFDYAQLEVVEITPDVNSDQLPITIEFAIGGKTAISVKGHAFRSEDENEEPYMTPDKVLIGNQSTYSPNFEDLDEELQDAIGSWLAGHGIDFDFFNNIIDLAVHKEEEAYNNWLSELKSAVKKIEQ
jgi:hypothetical protein